MTLLSIIAIVVALYVLIVFVVLRLIVPFMTLRGFAVPGELPDEVSSTINNLEARANNEREYLKLVYEFVGSRWHAGRMETLWYAPLAFRKNIEDIWKHPGYAHCTTQNYLVFVLLVGSKFFSAHDIQLKTVFLNLFIHQYLEVKVGGQWTDLEPAGSSIRGMSRCDHISFFG